MKLKIDKLKILYINVSVYPNPVSDILQINGKYSEINIFDLYGKLVLSSNAKKTIDISELSNGIYLVKINNNKIVKNFIERISKIEY